MNEKNTNSELINQERFLESDTLDIGILGAGFNGLETAYKVLKAGHKISVADIGEERIENLNKGNLSIQRPGWQEEFDVGLSKEKLNFTTEIGKALEGKEILFACTRPVPGNKGLDLDALFRMLDDVEEYISQFSIIVIRAGYLLGS